MITQGFAKLPARQQLLLVSILAVLALALVLLVLVVPAHNRLAALRVDQENAAADLDAAKVLTERYLQLQNNAPQSAAGSSLTALVNQSLQNKPFQPSRIQMSETGELQLRLENIEFEALLSWLFELEQSPGLLLSAISVNKAGGGVNVLLTLQQF